MNHDKSNNYVPALADTLDNSISKLYNEGVDNINNIKKSMQFIKSAHIDPILDEIGYNIKGTIENIKENPFKSGACIGISGSILGGIIGVGAYELLTQIDANPQGQYLFVGSNSEAAELQQKPYQIFEPHIDAVFDVNRNSWLMEQEAEIKNDPRFKPLMKNIYSLFNYPEPNHKLLMDLDKITSIKFRPNETDGGYDAVVYVGPMLAENAITISAGKIFNIPGGVDIRVYMDSIFSDAFYINEKYENLLKERKNEADREAKENKIIETRQNVISKAQEAKQETIDDFVSGNLDSMRNTIEVSDLDRFTKILNSYKFQDSDEMLSKLNIPENAFITYVEVDGIRIYNINLDHYDPDEGRINIIPTKDGFKALYDVHDSPQGRRVVSIIQKTPALGDLVLTEDVKAGVSEIFANEPSLDHYIIRDSKDGKPPFGIIGVPKGMNVRIGEILANNVDGVDNVGGIGQEYNGAEFKFPVSVSNGDGKDNGGSDTPVIPVIPIIPVIPNIPQNQCENVNNIVNNVDPVIDTIQDNTTPAADYTGEDYFDFTKAKR